MLEFLSNSLVTMKAYEFPALVSDEGKILLPESLKKNLSKDQAIRVIVLVDEPSDQSDENSWWQKLATQQMLSGYSEEDAIYDYV